MGALFLWRKAGGQVDVCGAHDELREQLKDHEKRIVALEKSDAQFMIRFDNLLEKIEGLTSWIKALVGLMLTTGLGFIIWYVQSLPR